MNLEEITDKVEMISANYARKFAINRDETWILLKLQEEMGELTQAFLMRSGQARTKGKTEEEIRAGFQAELADVFAQLLLLAHHCGVDLQDAIEQKWFSYLPEWKARFAERKA